MCILDSSLKGLLYLFLCERACDWVGAQKKALDPSKLELEVFWGTPVSLCGCWRSKLVLCKGCKCSAEPSL